VAFAVLVFVSCLWRKSLHSLDSWDKFIPYGIRRSFLYLALLEGVVDMQFNTYS
jgi:hypothetical protein